MTWYLETSLQVTMNQMSNGKKYSGSIIIGQRTFSYRIIFSRNIQALTKKELQEGSFYDLTKIHIRSNHQPITWTDDRRDVFSFLIDLAIQFYFDPLNQTLNSAPIPKGKFLSQIFQKKIGLEKKAVEVLSHPDFGCQLLQVSVN